MMVEAEGLEPPNLSDLIYSQAQLPLCHTSKVVKWGGRARGTGAPAVGSLLHTPVRGRVTTSPWAEASGPAEN